MASRTVKMTPVFEFQLGTAVLERQATIGKFDGTHPNLTCATTGGRIVVHCPHERVIYQRDTDVKFLNINKQPTALAAGALDPRYPVEELIVGTQISLNAYKIDTNQDLFYTEVPDGVNTMVFGKIQSSDQNLAIVGGNCSIQGFDEEGQERFWTVTGDNVTALALMPWDGSQGRNALLVGSEDFEIRVFRNEDVINEVTETDKVVSLVPLQRKNRFAYSLGNGTIGVYEGKARQWRYKSKHKSVALSASDVDLDGVEEILCGWSNGKVEARTDGQKGEAIFKDVFSSSVAAILQSDYRQDGKEIPLVCSVDGDVRGYITVEQSASDRATAHEEETLGDLMKEHQILTQNLASLDHQIDAKRKGISDASLPGTDTKVNIRLRPNNQTKAVDLVLQATGGGAIKAAVVTAEYLFGSNESLVAYAEEASDTLSISLAGDRQVSTELQIRALVGFNMSECFHVHELSFKLPKFAMFVPIQNVSAVPEGVVQFKITDRLNRLAMWLSSCFNLPPAKDGRMDSLEQNFVSCRTGEVLMISADQTGAVTLRIDNIDVAGELVQDMAQFMQIQTLNSTADFPTEFDRFRQILHQVDEYNAVRLKLTAEMADSSQMVKALVIKAEDARILNEMKHMKRMYGNLYDVNRELIGEYLKRSNNHNELMAALKEVNSMIQRAAKLRVGQPKTQVVSECRNAIKASSAQTFFKIIRSGAPS